MADSPSPDDKNNANSTPAPEVLKPQAEQTSEPDSSGASKTPPPTRHLRRGTYRPSHKATFIGLAVVVLILALNAGVIAFVLKGQSKSKNGVNSDQVTISQSALDNLGVNRTSVGDAGVQLVVGPAAKFNSKVDIGGDVSVGGQLILNSKFSAASASLAQLEAGNTSVQQLNVNGNTSLSTLALRNDLAVTGASRFQGAVTMTQLLTVNNGLNVTGSLAVGGALTVNNLHVSSLVVDSTTTLGGHVITRGTAPGVSAGGAVGTSGTVSISGNDMAGTVAVNAGGGAGGGIVATVSFRSSYSNTPHVVVTAVGGGASDVYVNRSASGFSIGVGALSVGGHAFDYIVEQ